MSNIYIQEPPALGKLLLHTSAGDIDIELWTKEAPKACRNFIQLCMEGYYNGTIFHRAVPSFIVQGGDPNGDGTGGESIYGETFKDEFHSRLRFNRRGLVAMANASKDDNGSQFFFTLAATPELQNKHTIFGKVTGDTIYNVLKLAEGDIGPDDRPEYPHKITGAEILINPFTDIVPRIVEKPVEDIKKKKKKEAVAVKNLGLLSFGDDAEEDESEAVSYRGKSKSSHDLLDDPKLGKKTAAELELEQSQSTEDAISNIREKLKSKRKEEIPPKDEKEDSDGKESSEEEYYIGKDRDKQRLKERDRIRDEIKQLKKEIKGNNSKNEELRMAEEERRKGEEASFKKPLDKNDLYAPQVDKYKKIGEKVPKKGQARSRRTKKLFKKKPWVKNLYQNREYPDNYTDTKFLEDLRKNLFVEKVTFKQAFLGSNRVVLRLCLCVSFAVLYVYMYNLWVTTDTVIYTSLLVTVLCYFLFVLYSRHINIVKHLKIVLVHLVIGYLLSPILHTLTDTVSTDTIFAWAVIMNAIHLIFFDYGVPAAIVSNSLSINASIFGSVCLASRLNSPFDAFILLTLSVIFFVVSPQFFKVFYKTNSFSFMCLSAVLLTSMFLGSVSMILLCYFLFVVSFLSFYCPYKFVLWQKYKDNIYGPWDEAVINDSDDLDDCLRDEILFR